MRKATFIDFIWLFGLAAIWGSAFFNLKIATRVFDPLTLALCRVFFAALVLLIYVKLKHIPIILFDQNWKFYASIGLTNLALPFFFISYGVKGIQSNLASVLMSLGPFVAMILGHFFLQKEKFSFLAFFGLGIGFVGILVLFFDPTLVNNQNIYYALIVLLGPICYTLGGLITLKLKNKNNEQVTTSCICWAIFFLMPMSFFIEQPWNMTFNLASTLSVLYLGVVATAIAWIMRFRLLHTNGLVFQSQVSYLIPIFGAIFGFIFLDEQITKNFLIALFLILLGLFLVEKSKSK